jgi:hypothetical protein
MMKFRASGHGASDFVVRILASSIMRSQVVFAYSHSTPPLRWLAIEVCNFDASIWKHTDCWFLGNIFVLSEQQDFVGPSILMYYFIQLFVRSHITSINVL